MQDHVRLLCLLLLGYLGQPVLADQSILHMAIGDPERRDREVELRLDSITDTATGEIITPPYLAQRLADTGLLFVGETHTSLEFHKVQLRTIQELHKAGREVLIGLEMFPYTQQSALDGWVAGDYTEQEFIDQADWYRYWGYHWGYYRDIFVFARDSGIKMYGINTPREVVTAVRKKGFRNLTEEEAAHIPHAVKPATEDQREMYKAFFDPDDALHMAEAAIDGMLRAQTAWDATMGWNALQALRDHGGEDAIMVVLIGSGHVTYGLGAERQTVPYYDGKIRSLIAVEILDDEDVPVETVRASFANYIWGLPQQQAEEYPSLGVSLMGEIGEQPTKIIQVSEDSVAERAGMLVGDVLLSLNGEPVESSLSLRKTVSAWRWGDMVSATIERERVEQELLVAVRRAIDEQEKDKSTEE